MITLPGKTEQALKDAEAIARSRLAKFPHDGVALHTLEQLGLIGAAVAGDASKLQRLREEFDLGLMAAKALGADEDEPFANCLCEIDAFVRAL